MGEWWVILNVKNLPYKTENRCVRADYNLRQDGKVSMSTSGLEKIGEFIKQEKYRYIDGIGT